MPEFTVRLIAEKTVNIEAKNLEDALNFALEWAYNDGGDDPDWGAQSIDFDPHAQKVSL